LFSGEKFPDGPSAPTLFSDGLTLFKPCRKSKIPVFKDFGAIMTVKTRFAPSPTGYLHIGGVRTALFSWAFARHHKGEFLLRIEDTDLARSTAESVNIILDGMKWVGLDYDNADNVVYQTRRFDRYTA